MNAMNRNPASIMTTALMVVILALTSLTMAVARGQTYVAGEVVICTGYGVTTISVDENGDPTGPVQLCPDMVLAMMSALDTPAPSVSRPEGSTEVIALAAIVSAHGLAAPAPRARAPPFFG